MSSDKVFDYYGGKGVNKMNKINFKEPEMHPFLVYFAHQEFGCYSKTIKEGETDNQIAGENEWLHPDLVGVKPLQKSFDEKVRTFYQHMNRDMAYFYSFELKREIKLGNLKQSYFQAVSNSSWANEGYLVTALLNKENKALMDEIERLVQAFGIGVILLNLENVDKSKVLFEAKKKTELDFFTINKLVKGNNSGFKIFIDAVNSYLEGSNKDVGLDYIVQKTNEIKKPMSLDFNTKKLESDTDDSELKESNLSPANSFVGLNLEDYSFKKIISLKIEDEIIPLKSWRELLLEVSKYCKMLNPVLFNEHCHLIKNSDNYLFFRDEPDYFESDHSRYGCISEEYYIYYHGSANELVKHTKKVANKFEIPLESILIEVESKK